MAADGGTISLRSDTNEAPSTRRDAGNRRPEALPDSSSAPAKAPRRSRLRWALFLLLPLALLVGGYWYVTGGQTMSTDDAYVEADKVGVSTDVAGIVKEIDVT